MSLTGFLSYSRVNWQQSPSKSTPLSAANLNLMDAGIKNNNDMISNLRDEITQLNSNNIRYDGMITNGSINVDSALFNNPNKDIYYYLLADSNSSIVGFPEGAYPYGVLLTITGHNKNDSYGKCQIYIPHYNENVSRGAIFVRTFADYLGENYIWRVFKPSEYTIVRS